MQEGGNRWLRILKLGNRYLNDLPKLASLWKSFQPSDVWCLLKNMRNNVQAKSHSRSSRLQQNERRWMYCWKETWRNAVVSSDFVAVQFICRFMIVCSSFVVNDHQHQRENEIVVLALLVVFTTRFDGESTRLFERLVEVINLLWLQKKKIFRREEFIEFSENWELANSHPWIQLNRKWLLKSARLCLDLIWSMHLL